MATDYESLADHKGAGVVFVGALVEGTLLDLVGLASHGGLVAGNVSAVDQQAVGRNAHARLNLDQVAYHQLRVQDSSGGAVLATVDSDVFVASLRDQLLELLLLHVVVSSSYTDDDGYCDEDGHALDPSVLDALLPDADAQGHEGSDEQDLEDAVLEVLQDQLPQSAYLRQPLLVRAKAILTVSNLS